MVKKILIGLAVVVVLLVAAVLIVPGMIPTDTYKQRIAEQVEAATGRELRIDGDIDVSVLPRLAIALEDVSFANAPGGEAEKMVTLKRLDAQLAIWPLLTGEVVVDRFVLVEPVIALEVDAQGRPNWDFSQAGGATAPAPSSSGGESAGGSGGGASLSDIRLGEFAITDGRVSYLDAASGTRQVLEDVDLTIALPNLDSPMDADGGLTWNDERISLSLGAANPRAFISGGDSEASLSVKSDPVNLVWSGQVTMGDAPAAAGSVELDVPSLREAAAWAGSPMPAQPEGAPATFGPLSIKGNVAYTDGTASFTEAEIGFDEIDATGALKVATGGAKPVLSGRLDVETLDVNPYMPAPAEGGAAGGGSGNGGGSSGGGQSGESKGWSTEPIDLTPLRAADADFTLTANAIKVREIEIGRSALTLTLKGGRLTADLTEMALYDGAGTATLVADGSGSVPAVEMRLDLKGVQAEPLLTDAAGFERLSGTANANAAITARGESQAALVAASQGQGGFQFTDGAIKGFNLGALVRNVESAFLDPSARETQSTDFSALQGTFTLTDGIMKNDDLSLVSPLLRVAGTGTVDLPQRTVDYRIEPRAVASAEGQGGRQDVAGVMVPVVVTGPWDNLSYRPDLEGMLKQQLGDPKGALEQLKNLGGGGTSSGSTSGTEGGGETTSPAGEAEKAIKGLFGR